MFGTKFFLRGTILLSLCFVFPGASLHSQVTEAWVARYDGPVQYDVDAPAAMAMDGEGNIYVTGSGYIEGHRDDYVTIKYDAEGNDLWVAYYNGPAGMIDRGTALTLDQGGYVYVTGTSSASASSYDYATIKYDTDGNDLWVARYNSPYNKGDKATAIGVHTAGNVYVAGTIERGFGWDWATVMYDSLGTQVWEATYHRGIQDEARDLVLDAAGNAFVAGDSWGPGTGPDYTIIKYNAAGTRLGVVHYNGPVNGTDKAYAFTLDGAGNGYATGESHGISGSYDILTIKYNASGVKLWEARYSGPGYDWERGSDIRVDSGGYVYVTGYSDQGTGRQDDYTTIKYDANGNELWTALYDYIWAAYPADDQATALALDDEGNVYVTGSSDGDFATIKYDSDGHKVWEARWGIYTSDGTCAIALDAGGSVYVTGESRYFDGEDWNSDIVTIKYVPGVVTVTLNCPVPFVTRGGKLRYDATFVNDTSIEQTFKGWSKVKLPNGKWLPGYVMTPMDIRLNPHETVTITLKHTIPPGAPLGNYEYWGFIGGETATIWNSGMFVFTVME